MDSSHAQMVSLIWNIADDVLRDVFVRGQYRDVILPMVVLRNSTLCLNPPTILLKRNTITRQKAVSKDEADLKETPGQNFYNTSKCTLSRLKSQVAGNKEVLLKNFIEYLNGLSTNVYAVLKSFYFNNRAKKLTNRDRVLAIIERVTDPDLNLTNKLQRDPDGLIIPVLTNIVRGQIILFRTIPEVANFSVLCSQTHPKATSVTFSVKSSTTRNTAKLGINQQIFNTSYPIVS